MHKKILLFSSTLLSLFILGGCTLKKNSNISQLFKKDDIYHVSLINTQKAQLIASLETKALLTATYLNPVYSSENCKNLCMVVSDAEYFFVGIFITDSEKNEFNKKGYLLTLNGKKPINIKKLDKDDPLRYQMPMSNNWSTYYKVKFPIVSENTMKLTFENDRFGKDVLNYTKGEKPLLESLMSLHK